eukprot:11568025-Alexandrium_andersonii.AAC.1
MHQARSSADSLATTVVFVVPNPRPENHAVLRPGHQAARRVLVQVRRCSVKVSAAGAVSMDVQSGTATVLSLLPWCERSSFCELIGALKQWQCSGGVKRFVFQAAPAQ